MQTSFDLVALSDRVAQVARRVLQFTAADVASAAKRSIKAGGKTLKAKNYAVSRPGEPPRSHLGTLKNAIRYRELDGGTWIIGPEKVGASSALKALEFGGNGSISSAYYAYEYVRTRKRRRKAKNPRIKPRAAKPYYVAGKYDPKGTRVTEYLYFNSSDTWERARASSRFQAWAATKRFREVKTLQVEARPFMRPALAKETAPNRMNSRWSRALR